MQQRLAWGHDPARQQAWDNRDRSPEGEWHVRLLGKSPWLLAAMSIALQGGCSTTTVVTPGNVTPAPPDCRVFGHVAYDGNRDYLPGVLVDDPTRPPDSVLHYAHEDRYGRDDLPAGVQLVNPLHLVGMPTGSGSLSLLARLDVMRDGRIVRSFAAAATLERSESMFSEGETFTAMRRKGLLLLKQNISAQVCADRRVTQAILDTPNYTMPRQPQQ